MYSVGQRWFSEAEPELGLGLITEVEAKTVKVTYPASEEVRLYGMKSAPLKRVRFKVGEKITTEDGQEYTIDEVKENNHILFYICQDKVIAEVDLKSDKNFTGPQDKIFAGNSDANALFNLRYDSCLFARQYQLLENKGLLGSKVTLIPHQCYVVHEVSHRLIPRVMLADEVGLGKTIEAGLIIKSLIQQNKISKVLVITPESLVYQWWVDLGTRHILPKGAWRVRPGRIIVRFGEPVRVSNYTEATRDMLIADVRGRIERMLEAPVPGPVRKRAS